MEKYRIYEKCYGKYKNYKDNYSYKTVHFNLKRKQINISCVNEDYVKLLQAINEKCKELRWLDE